MNAQVQFLQRRADKLEGMLQEAIITLEQSVEASTIVGSIACAFAFEVGRSGPETAERDFSEALDAVRAEVAS